jgi:hypothetical protein
MPQLSSDGVGIVVWTSGLSARLRLLEVRGCLVTAWDTDGDLSNDDGVLVTSLVLSNTFQLSWLAVSPQKGL